MLASDPHVSSYELREREVEIKGDKGLLALLSAFHISIPHIISEDFQLVRAQSNSRGIERMLVFIFS